MVHRAEQAEHAAGVPARAGDPVREGRRVAGPPLSPRRRGVGRAGGRPGEAGRRGGAEQEEDQHRRC
uniref:Uncharacterized protein n=1 Tax=Arundo donax TaxID=35708 RepID=A0A0A9HQ07_ARUDO